MEGEGSPEYKDSIKDSRANISRVFYCYKKMAYRETRRKYYWILAKDPETGRPFLIAGGETEEEARSKGLECLSGVDFEIRGLYTRNLARASQIIRGKRLEETQSLHQAKRRFGHERSLGRIKRRFS